MNRTPWHTWRAWHPVWTFDQGFLWATPWNRKPVWRCYTDAFNRHFPIAEMETMGPTPLYAVDLGSYYSSVEVGDVYTS